MSRGTITRRAFVQSAGAGVPLWSSSNLTRSYAPNAKTVWTEDVGGQLVQLTRTVGGIFYAQTEDTVHAISIYGNERWRYEKNGRASTVFPTNDVVYLSDRGTIHALLTTDGSERWHREGGDPVGPLTPTSIITGGEEIAALSRKTGEEQWSVEPPNGMWHSHSDAGDGRICAGTTAGNLVAISTRNGTVDWKVTVPEGGGILPYTSTGGFVLASDYEMGTLHVFDARTGELQWTIAFDGNTIVFPGAIGEDTVYYPSGTTLQAYAVEDGSPRWHADIGTGEYRRIRLIGGTVYVVTDERLQAYATAGGTLRWQFSTDDDHYHFPIGTTRDSLIVHSRKVGGKKKNETTYALSPTDGHVRWKYDHPAQTIGNHYIADDTVYFSTPDGTIQAIIEPGRSQLYDALRTVVSPVGVVIGSLLGAALLGGGYRRYRGNDADPESAEQVEGVPTWKGYEIHRRLNDETHLARTSDGNTVLLRRFHDFPENFEHDADEWAKLDIDGVQQVHDWGTDPKPWIALERAEGTALAKNSDAMDEGNVTNVVAETAEIVHRAHKRRVFHGSIAPENVVVTDAKVVLTNWRFTEPGDGREESVQADVRRLGHLCRSLLGDEPSGSLSDVLETATASDPAERYESALEFADMLRWAVRND